MNMQRFRKKPVVVEAVQITDSTFDAPHPNEEHVIGIIYDPMVRAAFIKTREGTMRGDIGDWIIRGTKGALYPCKPDVFADVYESADLPSPQAPAWSAAIEAAANWHREQARFLLSEDRGAFCEHDVVRALVHQDCEKHFSALPLPSPPPADAGEGE